MKLEEILPTANVIPAVNQVCIVYVLALIFKSLISYV